MTPTHTDPITTIERLPGGAIDFAHYDARARAARSGTFHRCFRALIALCRPDRVRSRDIAPAVAPDAPDATRPQTFLEQYHADIGRDQREFARAA